VVEEEVAVECVCRRPLVTSSTIGTVWTYTVNMKGTPEGHSSTGGVGKRQRARLRGGRCV